MECCNEIRIALHFRSTPRPKRDAGSASIIIGIVRSDVIIDAGVKKQ